MAPASPDRSRQRSQRRAWRSFTIYWSGHVVSSVGDYLSFVALPLAAYALTSSAIVVSAVDVAEEVATILFGTTLGVIADRMSPRRVLVITDLLRAALLALLAVAFAFDRGTWQLVVAVAFLLGTLRALHDGGEGGLMGRLIPRELEVRAFSRLELGDAIGQLVGSAIAGFATAVGLWFAFGLDAITFALAGLAAFAVGSRLHDPGSGDHGEMTATDNDAGPQVAKSGDGSERGRLGSAIDDMRTAFREMRKRPRYLQLLAVGVVGNFATVCVMGLFVPYAIETLGASTQILGILISFGGVGAIIASVLMGSGNRIRPDHATWGVLFMCLAIAAAGLFPSYVTASAAMLASGAGWAAFQTHYGSYRLRAFDSDLQGRVAMASRTVLYSAVLVALAFGGVIAEYWSPASLFASYGLLSAAAIIGIGLWRVEIDSDVTDA